MEKWEGAERREFPRANFRCKITVFIPFRHAIVTYTKNIGCGGIRVIIEERLKLFSIVGLEVCIDGGAPLQCKGKIVWQLEEVHPLRKDVVVFDIGLEFVEIKDSDKERVNAVINRLLDQ